MSSLYRLIFISGLIGILNISNATIVEPDNQSGNNYIASGSITTGYSALKLFLEDEQHLTFVRRAKMIVTFSDISDNASSLIDDIADSSEQALIELKKLEKAKPRIIFDDFSDDTIAKATFDSLRMASVKVFLFEFDNFEKNLLLSQLQVLPVISHLAMQLEKKETNQRRKIWLGKLATRYEKHYQQVNQRVLISRK